MIIKGEWRTKMMFKKCKRRTEKLEEKEIQRYDRRKQ